MLACALPGLAVAQERPVSDATGRVDVCGTLYHIDGHRPLFVLPKHESYREDYGIARLEPSDPQGIVRDTTVCRELVRYVEDELGGPLSPSEYGVYRFEGIYMLDLWFGDGCVEMQDGTTLCGFGSMEYYLFRAGTLEHIVTVIALG